MNLTSGPNTSSASRSRLTKRLAMDTVLPDVFIRFVCQPTPGFESPSFFCTSCRDCCSNWRDEERSPVSFCHVELRCRFSGFSVWNNRIRAIASDSKRLVLPDLQKQSETLRLQHSVSCLLSPTNRVKHMQDPWLLNPCSPFRAWNRWSRQTDWITNDQRTDRGTQVVAVRTAVTANATRNSRSLTSCCLLAGTSIRGGSLLFIT